MTVKELRASKEFKKNTDYKCWNYNFFLCSKNNNKLTVGVNNMSLEDLLNLKVLSHELVFELDDSHELQGLVKIVVNY